MADDADRTQERTEAFEEQVFSHVKPYTLPVGVEGECYECGEHSMRLIDGMCARCRDLLAKFAPG